MLRYAIQLQVKPSDPITHTQCAPDKHPRIIVIRQLASRASALLAAHPDCQRRQQSDKLLDIQASGSQLYNDASISREAGIQEASHDALICDAVRRTRQDAVFKGLGPGRVPPSWL
ncbi:uncharacterized protein LOC127010871 [Drosophila biarmipes]|uniref:uncharacterized protein LOC127010871 n=1 Tax=Drosophila biarmipes TaxID=125945 RepID=UPI0021CCE56C|nr:uncharacterized protein LOC127010871 [Drosophila biarmipes]